MTPFDAELSLTRAERDKARARAVELTRKLRLLKQNRARFLASGKEISQDEYEDALADSFALFEQATIKEGQA